MKTIIVEDKSGENYLDVIARIRQKALDIKSATPKNFKLTDTMRREAAIRGKVDRKIFGEDY